jgi:hypothetical protein
VTTRTAAECLTIAASEVSIAVDADALDRLGRIEYARKMLDEAYARSVDDLRARGTSWAGIGELLGITKQAAQQRFGQPRVLEGEAVTF